MYIELAQPACYARARTEHSILLIRYAYDRVRQHTDDLPLHYWSTCSPPQGHASQAAATSHHDSQKSADPLPALAPAPTKRFSRSRTAVAARPMVAVALEQLQAMLTSASPKQRGTGDSAAAALLALGMSAQYGPCRDRARSPAPCACAASSRGTLCLTCLETRCASYASSRHLLGLMVRMQRRPQSKSCRAQQRWQQRPPAQSRPAPALSIDDRQHLDLRGTAPRESGDGPDGARKRCECGVQCGESAASG